LLSTIISAISLIVAINLMRGVPNYPMVFIAAFLANFLSVFAPSYIFLPIPYFSIIFGVVIWTIMVKFLLRTEWSHALTIGALAYGINFALEILNIISMIRFFIGI